MINFNFRITKEKTNILKKAVALILACLMCCLVFVGCSDDDKNKNTDEWGQASGGTQKPSSGKPKRDKVVALTFDDGPHNVRSKQIADELAKYGYNATFFVVGNRIADAGERKHVYDGSEAVKYIASKGNEIGIHGYTHNVYYNKCDDATYKEELLNTKKAINSVVKNANVKLMRPIGGAITEERVNSCEYAVIMWSVDSEDWKYREASDDVIAKTNIDTIVNNVMSVVKSGDIILMHDIYENTYEATKIILKQLHDKGYDVVTVSDLLGNPPKGKKYSRLKTETQEANAVVLMPQERKEEI